MKTAAAFPELRPARIAATRAALHGYAGVLGDWLKSCRPKRKHWWHASLRPSLTGLTTGVVHAGIDFELQLDLRAGALRARTATGGALDVELRGQPAAEIAAATEAFLVRQGLERSQVPAVNADDDNTDGYSAERAIDMAVALNSVGAAMTAFRAGLREETSPVQLWPHHFDLSLLWLPGGKVPGADPEDAESADRQMNFGFTFGDDGIPEPYFYITAWPQPDSFPAVTLPAGSEWHSDGFEGVVFPYRLLREGDKPVGYLLELWQTLVAAGRRHMSSG